MASAALAKGWGGAGSGEGASVASEGTRDAGLALGCLGEMAEQSHEQRGVELIQPRRGPLGRHGSNTPQHQTHPGNTAAFVQELKRSGRGGAEHRHSA